MSMIKVRAGEHLQAAMDAAKGGDVLQLEAGATFVGTHTLSAKTSPVTVTTSAALPDRRITLADDPLLPRLASEAVAPALLGEGGKNWIFDGLRILPTHEGHYNAILLDEFKLCDNVSFDRILFQGHETFGQRRVLSGNGTRITLTRSAFYNVFRQGDENAGFGAWNGAGPYTIRDCFFEVAGINVLFGGANSTRPEDVPADILVENCHMTKRDEWRPGGAKHATVKNLFEVKSGKRITVRNCRMEHNWPDAQPGHGVLFTCSNDGEQSPWTTIEDVLFERNVLLDSFRGININGTGYGAGSTQQLRRVVIRHNDLCEGFQIGGEAGEVTFDHNTFRGKGIGLLYRGGIWRTGEQPRDGQFAVERFVYTNNLARYGEGGLVGDGVGSGLAALQAHAKTFVVTHNVLAGAPGHVAYPEKTYRPTEAEHAAQFDANGRVKAGSVYLTGDQQGGALGANLDVDIPLPPLPPPIDPPPPPPPPTGGDTIVDADGATWTFGPNKETLRDGVHMGDGRGTQYRLIKKTVYVFGINAAWYRWVGSKWEHVAVLPPDEPKPDPAGELAAVKQELATVKAKVAQVIAELQALGQ